MHRRKFISSSCKLCAISVAGYMLPQLSGCASALPAYKTGITNGEVSVPLSLFQTNSLQLVRPNGWYYNIAVRKKEDDTYSALLLQCTHQDNQLTPTGNGYHCNMHGSEFDKNGSVTKGPAEVALHHFETTVNNNQLNIQIKNFKP